MKKYFFAFFLFVEIFVYSQNIPNQLYGIWESKDRYVFFERGDGQNRAENQVAIYLKTYYGWYVDRTAEPEKYAEQESRTRNAATVKKGEQIFFTTEDIRSSNENGSARIFPDDDCAFEINLKYSKNDYAKIPVAIIKNNMYLNFYAQDEENPNFYKGNAASEGLKISAQKTAQNLSCLYFYENRFFDVRYWLSDMDYENSKVSLEYDGAVFFVSKHIFSAGNNYSCVSGRGKKIRNVVAPFVFEKDESENGENFIYYIEDKNQNAARKFFFNEDKSILIFDESPYLVKLIDKDSFEDLIEIAKKTNSQSKPEPKPLFPPNNLDWHWDLIDYIEKDDKIIQEVRLRQKEFGPRAKDFEKSNDR